jgi:hypothetical protein
MHWLVDCEEDDTRCKQDEDTKIAYKYSYRLLCTPSRSDYEEMTWSETSSLHAKTGGSASPNRTAVHVN